MTPTPDRRSACLRRRRGWPAQDEQPARTPPAHHRRCAKCESSDTRARVPTNARAHCLTRLRTSPSETERRLGRPACADIGHLGSSRSFVSASATGTTPGPPGSELIEPVRGRSVRPKSRPPPAAGLPSTKPPDPAANARPAHPPGGHFFGKFWPHDKRCTSPRFNRAQATHARPRCVVLALRQRTPSAELSWLHPSQTGASIADLSYHAERLASACLGFG